MGIGAFLVNVSSSHLIDEAALAAALLDGSLKGAALNTDGYDLVHGPLKGAKNLVCIPNSASLSECSIKQFR